MLNPPSSGGKDVAEDWIGTQLACRFLIIVVSSGWHGTLVTEGECQLLAKEQAHKLDMDYQP